MTYIYFKDYAILPEIMTNVRIDAETVTGHGIYKSFGFLKVNGITEARFIIGISYSLSVHSVLLRSISKEKKSK